MADAIAVRFTAKDQFTRVSKKMDRALQSNRANIRGLNRTMTESAAKTKKAGGVMVGTFGKISKSIGLAAVAAGLLKGVMASFNQGANLQQNVNAVLRNFNPEQIAKFSPLIKETIVGEAARSGIARNDVAEALRITTSALGGNQKALDALKPIITFAVASGTNAAEAATLITKAVANQPELTGVAGAAAVTNIVTEGAKFGQIDAAALSRVLPDILGSTALVGLKLGETVAIVTALASKLGGPESAAQALRDLTSAQFGALPGSANFRAFAAAGLQVGPEAAGQTGEDLLRGIQKLRDENPLFFRELLATEGLRKFGGALNEDFIQGVNANLARQAAVLADPSIGSQVGDFRRATEGELGTRIRAQAAKDRALDAGAGKTNVLSEGASILLDTATGGRGGISGDVALWGTMFRMWGDQIVEGFRDSVEKQRANITFDARGNAIIPTGGLGSAVETD